MEKINVILTNELNRTQKEIIQNAINAGKKVTGKTINSLRNTVYTRPGFVEGEITAAPYFFTLEKGRGPAKGTSSGQSDFLDNLRQWIRQSDIEITSDEQAERIAKFFKWYINKFGTKLYRDGGRNDIFTPPLKDFENRIGAIVGNHYLTELEKML